MVSSAIKRQRREERAAAAELEKDTEGCTASDVHLVIEEEKDDPVDSLYDDLRLPTQTNKTMTRGSRQERKLPPSPPSKSNQTKSTRKFRLTPRRHHPSSSPATRRPSRICKSSSNPPASPTSAPPHQSYPIYSICLMMETIRTRIR